jgi:hypothetical protein
LDSLLASPAIGHHILLLRNHIPSPTFYSFFHVIKLIFGLLLFNTHRIDCISLMIVIIF